jgi:ankyrin repeat protein
MEGLKLSQLSYDSAKTSWRRLRPADSITSLAFARKLQPSWSGLNLNTTLMATGLSFASVYRAKSSPLSTKARYLFNFACKIADSLIWAAKRGDLVALEIAIRSAANLNAKDSKGWTPLFHAAHKGNTKALQLLIDAGADVNRGREIGFTALFAAVGAGHVDAFACFSTQVPKSCQ